MYPMPLPHVQATPLPVKPGEKWQSAGCVLLAGNTPELRNYVMVVKPSNNFGPWSLPKGQIDAGEHAMAAALREVFEETGIRAKLLENSYLGAYLGFASVTHYFVATIQRMEKLPDSETEKTLMVTLEKAIEGFRYHRNFRDACVIEAATNWLRENT